MGGVEWNKQNGCNENEKQMAQFKLGHTKQKRIKFFFLLTLSSFSSLSGWMCKLQRMFGLELNQNRHCLTL